MSGIAQDIANVIKKDNEVILVGVAADASRSYISNGAVVDYTTEQSLAKSQFQRNAKWSNEVFAWVSNLSPDQKTVIQENSIKSERDSLLYKSDWTQIPNNPLTVEKQNEWAVYRQSLRDVTSQSGYPFNVVWPTQPR